MILTSNVRCEWGWTARLVLVIESDVRQSVKKKLTEVI